MRTDPNQSVSIIDEYYGICSQTMRAAQSNQIMILDVSVPAGLGPEEYNPTKFKAELDAALLKVVPQLLALESKYVVPPPDADVMIGLRDDFVAAYTAWLKDGKPPIPALGPTSQGQGG